MCTSAADVFRTRQVISDLTAHITRAGRSAFCRISPRHSRLDGLFAAPDDGGGAFAFPRDRDLYGEVLLAAALPDDDFPAFTTATVLLLLDRIGHGAGMDDLYWNWDAFADHYRLADPPVRAVIMNGFRTAAAMGRVSVSQPPEPEDCFTARRQDVLALLRRSDVPALCAAIEQDVSAGEAGELWSDWPADRLTPETVAGFRYLYERPASVAPAQPDTAALIPWTL